MMIMFTTIGGKDVVLLSTPCTKLLGGGSGGHKQRRGAGCGMGGAGEAHLEIHLSI